jgi:hypothetical protein
MSFHTIFVVIPKAEGPIVVAPHLDASEALDYLRRWGVPGEVYACRVSESGAAAIREKCSLQLLKTYSLSMQHCADVT